MMYALGAVFGLLALAISHLSARPAYTIAALAGVAVLGAVALLERAPYERQTRRKRFAVFDSVRGSLKLLSKSTDILQIKSRKFEN